MNCPSEEFTISELKNEAGVSSTGENFDLETCNLREDSTMLVPGFTETVS